jgi:hypothetical protein
MHEYLSAATPTPPKKQKAGIRQLSAFSKFLASVFRLPASYTSKVCLLVHLF